MLSNISEQYNLSNIYLSVFVFQLLVSGHLNIEESQLTKTIQWTVSFGKHKQFSNSVSLTRQYFKTLTSYWPMYLPRGALGVIILLKTIILDPVVPPISWDSVSNFSVSGLMARLLCHYVTSASIFSSLAHSLLQCMNHSIIIS